MQLAGWQALGIPAEYFRIEIPAGELEMAVPQLIQAGLSGWNCTLPHKGEMFRLSQIKDSSALEAESVNTVQILKGKVHGSSTDAAGWARAISEVWPNSLPPRRVLLLGCGGVGQSIARFLARTGCDSLTLVNRDPLRAQRLLRELTPLVAGRFPIRQMDWDLSALREALKETDLLLHGTSLGLKEKDPSPIPEEHLNPPMRIYDTLYRKVLPPLVQAGRKRGCLAVDGLGMLLYQGALSLELWSKKPAPIQAMRTALEQFAGRNL
jgi:shikimate dehydrogenase